MVDIALFARCIVMTLRVEDRKEHTKSGLLPKIARKMTLTKTICKTRIIITGGDSCIC